MLIKQIITVIVSEQVVVYFLLPFIIILVAEEITLTFIFSQQARHWNWHDHLGQAWHDKLPPTQDNFRPWQYHCHHW